MHDCIDESSPWHDSQGDNASLDSDAGNIIGDAGRLLLLGRFWRIVLDPESTLVPVAFNVESTLAPVGTAVESSLYEHVESHACNRVVTGMITDDWPAVYHQDKPLDINCIQKDRKTNNINRSKPKL